MDLDLTIRRTRSTLPHSALSVGRELLLHQKACGFRLEMESTGRLNFLSITEQKEISAPAADVERVDRPSNSSDSGIPSAYDVNRCEASGMRFPPPKRNAEQARGYRWGWQ